MDTFVWYYRVSFYSLSLFSTHDLVKLLLSLFFLVVLPFVVNKDEYMYITILTSPHYKFLYCLHVNFGPFFVCFMPVSYTHLTLPTIYSV